MIKVLKESVDQSDFNQELEGLLRVRGLKGIVQLMGYSTTLTFDGETENLSSPARAFVMEDAGRCCSFLAFSAIALTPDT